LELYPTGFFPQPLQAPRLRRQANGYRWRAFDRGMHAAEITISEDLQRKTRAVPDFLKRLMLPGG
jgi:hypothetical protein